MNIHTLKDRQRIKQSPQQRHTPLMLQGLRNALRKSRTHRRSDDESLELQPLHCSAPETSTPKGPLRRMQRVKSHDLSQEDASHHHEQHAEPITSPLGAGLPLLSRLRLLKEKQEHEERSKSSTPPVLSPSPSSVKSPPPVPEEAEEEPREVVGAGLPLLQRLLLLKSKEEVAQTQAQVLPTVPVLSPPPQKGGNQKTPRPPVKVSLRERLRLQKEDKVRLQADFNAFNIELCVNNSGCLRCVYLK